jgi:hypothetical protein
MGSSVTSAHLSVDCGFFAPAWLPPGGHGNGLNAPAWAPIGDFDPVLVEQVLSMLAEYGVPGYAARCPAAAGPRARGSTSRWRLWVATGSYTRAEDLLVAHLPRLLHPRGRGRAPG